MKARSESARKSEAIVITALLAVWFALWLLTPQVSLPVPPYHDHPGASRLIQMLACAWAALLLLLPFLLPVCGGHFAFRKWRRDAGSQFFGLVLFAITLVPVLVVGIGILRRILDPASTDSAESLLFYWWPR